MKQHYCKRLITVCLLWLCVAVTVKAQVFIKVSVLPPYSSHISDFVSHPQQVMIVVNNTGSTPLDIQLRGSMTGDNGITIAVNRQYKSPTPLHLAPQETKTLTGTDINALFNYNQLVFTGMSRDQLVARGNLPEGNYQICVQAFDYRTNTALSEDDCSNSFPITSAEPPVIISPADGNEISNAGGQNFVITWSTPAGAPPSTQYVVKMVEILDERSPENAIQTSTQPAFFQTTVTGTNALLYNPAMPSLTPGRRYAMAVTAIDPSNTVVFRNNGQSEVVGFTYGSAETMLAETSSTVIKMDDSTFVIYGNIKWYFRQGEETAPQGRSGPLGPGLALPNTPAGTGYPYANLGVKINMMANYNSTDMSSVMSRVTSRKKPPNMTEQEWLDEQNDLEQQIEAEIWQGAATTVTTDANGNFQWRININAIKQAVSTNIGTRTGVKSYPLTPENFTLTAQVQNDRLNLNSTWANDYGYATATIAYSTLVDAGQYSMGNLVALPRSYKFVPKVVDANGNELTDAVINVYRRADFYTLNPILQYEGNINPGQPNRQTVNIGGVDYIKIAAIPSSHTATRLFYTDGGTDSYKILIQDGNYTDYNTSIAVRNPDEMYDTYMPTYSMASVPVTFSGHVHKTINNTQIDAAGAIVQMFDMYGNQYFTAADSAGNFTIINGLRMSPMFGYQAYTPCNLTASPHYQYFYVTYHGQATIDSVLIDKPGEHVNKEIAINVAVYNVSGTIIDSGGTVIPSPLVRWASGGNYISTDAQGNFTTQANSGADTLIIDKLGYSERHIPVIIEDGGLVIAKTGVTNTTPNNGTGSRLSTISRTNPGGVLNNAINGQIGKIILAKSEGRLQVTVTDANNQPLQNALVKVFMNDDALATVTTGSNGMAQIAGPSGWVSVYVKPADNGHSVANLYRVYVQPDGTLAMLTAKLANGIRITGTVKANSTPVAGAVVGIEYNDYFTATTQSDGTYSLVVPAGYNSLVATKQGLLQDTKTGTYNTDQVLNFTLTQPSVSITKMLGFSVQVDAMKDNGDTKTITGEFINLPSNPVFSVDKNTRLRFYNISVKVQGGGIAIPVDDRVETDQSSINIKAFNYLPMTMQDNNDDDDDVLVISKTDATGLHGQIKANLAINFSNFMPAGIAPYAPDGMLVTTSAGNSMPVIITDDGNANSAASMPFLLNGGSNYTFNIYGFNISVDLANSFVKQDGVHLTGSVDARNVPIMAGSQINLSDIWIGTNGAIKSISAQTPSVFKIASWQGQVNDLSFDDNGFKLAGMLSLQLPGNSSGSTISFNSLQMSTSQLYGGSFTLPSGGVNVYGVANITSSNPYTFGRQGSENVYYINGNGNINFTGAAASYIDNLGINNFQIETNGAFAIDVAANIHKNFFGIATVDITRLDISDINDHPDIYVAGNFNLSVPGVSATVGGLHVGKGGSVSVDDLGFGIDVVGIAKAQVNVSFENDAGGTGFAGNGSFSVPGLADISVYFRYLKINGALNIDTRFSASTAIPLGSTGFVVTQVGGGFSVSQTYHTWGVWINGFVSVGEGTFTGASVGFSIVSKPAGPVISGNVGIEIGSLKVANGNLTIDIPNQLFTASFGSGIDIAGVSFHAAGNLVLSLNKSDRYFLLGTYVNMNSFGILKLQGAACIAFNFNINKHRHDFLSTYISCIDPDVMSSGVFTGISASGNFNVSLDGILPNFDFDIPVFVGLSVHSHCDFDAWGYVTMGLVNNTTPTFAVNFGVDASIGASISVTFLEVLTVGVSFNVGFDARFKGLVSVNPYYLKMEASAGAYIQVALGDFTIDPRKCVNGYDLGNWPNHDWVSICLGVSLTVGYTSNGGFYAHF